MLLRVRASYFAAILLAPICLVPLRAQRAANSNAIYQQLRGLTPGSQVIAVSNLELHRDAGTFTFHQGSFSLYGEVNGKVTGAVFKGDGHFHLAPPTDDERHNMSVLAHTEVFDDDFDELVLRFTDQTADELKKSSSGPGSPDGSFERLAHALHDFERLKLKDNLDLRLLEDVLSPAPGGFFLAAIHGKTNSHLIYTVDPHGAGELAPEEVSLLNWNDWGGAYLAAFHQASDSTHGGGNNDEKNLTYNVDHEDLDVSIEKGGFLTGLATVHLTAVQDGVAIARFNLYPTLRVSRAETDKGEPLDFVQEKKDEDADFGVLLARPLQKGESTVVRIAYGGKDVVRNEGGANYYPVARESWYPNASTGLGDYATYHMLFHVPKDLQLIATGTKTGGGIDGRVATTEWKTDVPLAVVGFNLGKFAMKEAKLESKQGGSLTIDAYANTAPPDSLTQVDGPPVPIGEAPEATAPIGTFNPSSMLPVELSQAQVAAQIYTDYFGALPFAQVAVTQQYACDYGQSWPMLVFLPSCAFMDRTQQHFTGMRPEDMYWKVVTPHEMAHQWWGQTVGFRSYRDQWMSEGFADESASIFLQATRPKPNDFLDFWREQRKLITEKNAMGFRPNDVGPVTMGFRLSTDKTGWDVYQDLVYPKGAYILHMIRMMMWTPQEGDDRFKATMHDLVNSYRLQSATTEDFKAVVERHMSPGMDLDQNHRMDWFFNQYVYGTDLPNYHFNSQFTQSGDATSLHFELTQSGVPSNFKMLVPIYLELVDGRVMRLGSMGIVGSSTSEHTVQLPKLPAPIKRVSINYFYDVLSTEN